jgi:hypothetical protein
VYAGIYMGGSVCPNCPFYWRMHFKSKQSVTG